MPRNLTALVGLFIATTFGVLVISPALAQATPRSVGFDYYCKASSDGNAGQDGSLECSPTEAALLNPTGPTFQPKPEPTITTYGVGISYDPVAGTLTYVQTQPDSTTAYDPSADCANPDEANPDECDTNGMQSASIWADTGIWTLSHGPYTPGAATGTTLSFGGGDGDNDDAYSDWSGPATQVGYGTLMGLSENGVRGTLQPVVSVGGNAITFVWSSSLLKNLNMTKVETSSESAEELPFSFGPAYFPGDAPMPPPPPLGKVITGTYSPKVKPPYLTVTGDGSGWFAGSVGRKIVPRAFKNIGKLDWTHYSATSADAVGQSWIIYGTGCSACDKQFEDIGTIKLHLFDPVDGVFSKMTVSEPAETFRYAGGTVYHYKAQTDHYHAYRSTYSGDSYYDWR